MLVNHEKKHFDVFPERYDFFMLSIFYVVSKNSSRVDTV